MKQILDAQAAKAVEGGAVGTPVREDQTQQAPSQEQAQVIPPETIKAVSTAEAAVRAALEISPEALSTQADIDRVQESLLKAATGIKDQPIPMPFITGQLASTQRQALSLLEPLEARAARLQAKRLSSLEASKFALNRADKRLEQAREDVEPGELEDLITLSPGQSIFDPNTGEIIGTAPAKPADPRAPTTLTTAQGIMQWNPSTQAWESTGLTKPTSDSAIKAAGERDAAAIEAKSTASRMVGRVTELLSDEGSLGAISGALRTPFTNREATNRLLNLKALLTLENIDKLKGSMSDKDLLFIEQAGSIISGSINEKGTSNLPTSVLIQELKNIRGMFQLQAGGTVDVEVSAPGGEPELFENATREEIDSWFAQGALIDFR